MPKEGIKYKIQGREEKASPNEGDKNSDFGVLPQRKLITRQVQQLTAFILHFIFHIFMLSLSHREHEVSL